MKNLQMTPPDRKRQAQRYVVFICGLRLVFCCFFFEDMYLVQYTKPIFSFETVLLPAFSTLMSTVEKAILRTHPIHMYVYVYISVIMTMHAQVNLS